MALQTQARAVSDAPTQARAVSDAPATSASAWPAQLQLTPLRLLPLRHVYHQRP
jgi:hypothetical protein